LVGDWISDVSLSDLARFVRRRPTGPERYWPPHARLDHVHFLSVCLSLG